MKAAQGTKTWAAAVSAEDAANLALVEGDELPGEPDTGDPSGQPDSDDAPREPDNGGPEARTAADRGSLRHIVRSAFVVITGLAFCLALDAVGVSWLQHRSAQVRAFSLFRGKLAQGTAPVALTDASNHPLPLGTPVALIDVPSLHIHEVVGEGTTSGVLMAGPAHRRDTPLPGQAGTTVIFGRRAAFGGPFERLDHLRVGATIVVTTGQGVSKFKVIDRRRAGDRAPPPTVSGQGRLQLVTATGIPFIPSGVLRVDADLVTATLDSSPVPTGALAKAEQPLGTDPSTAWALVFWIQALIAIAVGAVWSWLRWGHHQTWIVFLPVATLAALGTSGQVLRLLPNLL
jgi:LPXTG-site transpeptidase (sortase) family protein